MRYIQHSVPEEVYTNRNYSPHHLMYIKYKINNSNKCYLFFRNGLSECVYYNNCSDNNC